jgi:hypothetical protein
MLNAPIVISFLVQAEELEEGIGGIEHQEMQADADGEAEDGWPHRQRVCARTAAETDKKKGNYPGERPEDERNDERQKREQHPEDEFVSRQIVVTSRHASYLLQDTGRHASSQYTAATMHREIHALIGERAAWTKYRTAGRTEC